MRPSRDELLDAIDDLERAATACAHAFAVGERRAEDGHEAVTEELVHDALVLGHASIIDVEERVEVADDLLRARASRRTP